MFILAERPYGTAFPEGHSDDEEQMPQDKAPPTTSRSHITLVKSAKVGHTVKKHPTKKPRQRRLKSKAIISDSDLAEINTNSSDDNGNVSAYIFHMNNKC